MRGGQGEGYWAAPGYKGGTRKPTTAQALSGSRALISVSSGGFGRLRGAPGFRDRLIGRPVCASASKRSRPSLPLKKQLHVVLFYFMFKCLERLALLTSIFSTWAIMDNAQPTIHQPENGAAPQRGSCSILVS